ncbi:MAG: hypothetical protein R2726_23500 [Acidimicrobiales bacterium]
MRKLLASTAAGLALFGGSVAIAATGFTGIAGAQDNGQQTQSTQPGDAQHPLRHRIRHFAKQAVDEVAKDLNMSSKDLVAELRSGKSIADVAQEKGVPLDTIVNDLVGKVDARIDEAVTNGKLTQEKADQLKAKVPERIDTLVHRQLQGRAANAQR